MARARKTLTDDQVETLDLLASALHEDPDATRVFYVGDKEPHFKTAKQLERKGYVEVVDRGGKGDEAFIEVAITDEGLSAVQAALANPTRLPARIQTVKADLLR